MTTLILAAGNQTRWEKDHPVRFKQLLPICGEPVLHRIVRQVRARGDEPIIVTHRDELLQDGFRYYEPNAHRWTVETLWNTCPLWKGRTRVLLGDTAYSRTQMDKIFAYASRYIVFGNEYEIYAISFDAYDEDTLNHVAGAIAKAFHHAANGGPGTLRMFYEALSGVGIGSGKIESVVMDRVCYIQDYTKDFDTPNDYKEFLNKWERKGLVDDLPE